MTLVIAKNINLIFPIYNSAKSLRNKILKSKKSENISYIHALKNINLQIDKGDRIGLIGKNGSGKTTLLKILAQIYFPSNGFLEISEKPFSILDPNMGLNMDATGVENIKMISHLFNLEQLASSDSIRKIKDFSELGKFIDLPVRTYSSGMRVRLTTSINVQINPKFLIIDEFFGAGDKSFIEKARLALNEKFTNLDGLVLASHQDSLIKSICNRIITLDKGEIISDKTI